MFPTTSSKSKLIDRGILTWWDPERLTLSFEEFVWNMITDFEPTGKQQQQQQQQSCEQVPKNNYWRFTLYSFDNQDETSAKEDSGFESHESWGFSS